MLVESYAALKSFLLYTSYIGVLHLGYVDGIYIKYGGKTISAIDTEEFTKERNVLSLFQLGITVLSVLIAFLIGDSNLLFATISIL